MRGKQMLENTDKSTKKQKGGAAAEEGVAELPQLAPPNPCHGF